MSVVVSISERRTALRVDIDLPAYVSELEDAGEYSGDEEVLYPLFGQILNLSETGMLVRSPEPVCPGRTVRAIARYEDKRIELLGDVVRVHHIPCEQGALIAVVFRGLRHRVRNLIHALIDACRTDPILN